MDASKLALDWGILGRNGRKLQKDESNLCPRWFARKSGS